jgi:hypothetical protein
MQEYKIYYFSKTKLNPNPLVEHNLWSLELFEKSMRTLNPDISTLIYLEDLETMESCVQIQKLFLKLKDEGKIYSNLTIYNKTTFAHRTIFQLPIFKKVLNIFPFDKTISICSDSVIDALKYINKTISVVFDPSQPPDSCYSLIKAKGEKFINIFPEQKGGNLSSPFEQIYNFRIMETNEEIVEPEQTWWYKYYFSIPPCAYGRLSQSSGTCWLNTVLNIIFLTQPIAEILVAKYKTLDKDLVKQVEEIKIFLDIAAKVFPLKVILWSMVRLLLIKKKKALTLDSNFMLVIGAKVKSLHMYGNENYWLENNFGADFGNSYDGGDVIGIILSLMLEEMEDFIVLLNIRGLDYKIRQQIDKEYEEYTYLRDTFDGTVYFLELAEKIEPFTNLQYEIFSLVKNMVEGDELISLKWCHLILEIDHLNLFKNFNPSNPPKILIIPIYTVSNIKNIPEILYIDDTEYKLNALSLMFNLHEFSVKHDVSCLICGSKYYIYDSNDILTYDSWNKSVYNEYINALNDHYKVNEFAYEYKQNFLLYIKT